MSGGALAEGKYAEAVINLDSLMITSVRWKIPAEDLCRCNLTVLATAIYCTWVEKMTDVVALPKPKFTSQPGHMTGFTMPRMAIPLIPVNSASDKA